MTNQEKHEVVEYILATCLAYLVEIGFVAKEAINGKYYSRYDMNDRLQHSQFVAGTSIDDIDIPVVVFDIRHNIETVAWVLAHEAIHLAQICKGDFKPFKGYSIWQGKKYTNLLDTDENYFSKEYQPWEAEARELEEKVRDAMYEKLPALKRS